MSQLIHYSNLAAIDPDSSLREQSDRFGIQLVLYGEYPSCKGLWRIVRRNADSSLQNDRTCVVFLVHEMYGCTGSPRAAPYDGFVDTFPVHTLATECRKKRGVYINDTVSVHFERRRSQFLHVTCKNHQIDTVRPERFSDRTVEGTGLRVRPTAEVNRWNAGPPCPGKRPGPAIVADDNAHTRREPSRNAPVEYRLQIGPSPRGEYPQAIDGIPSGWDRCSTLRHGDLFRWLTLQQMVRRGRCRKAGSHPPAGTAARRGDE